MERGAPAVYHQPPVITAVRFSPIHNLASSTQRAYVEHVARFARHFSRSLARLGPAEITTANVVAVSQAFASQQIVAGELAEVLAAIRAGVAYVNVHATPLNPGGEIRGQFPKSEHHDDKR